MKKSISVIAAASLILAAAACDGGNSNNTTTTPAAAAATTTTAAETTTTAAETTTEAETTKAPVAAEPISAEPLVHLGFETTDGLSSVERNDDNSGLTDTSTKGNIVASSHDILLAEGQGAVGNALYLDGKYGVDFDMPEIDDDSYTIAFWYNADRVATFGPVVQMGRNIATADADNPCTWINVTKTTWGVNDADIFPVVWNRNSSISTEVAEGGVFPWCEVGNDSVEHGKREWAHIAIVTTGDRYVADFDGMERIASKFYLNGELMWDCNAENMFYQGLSPEIFAGANTEGHIGINYWDTIFKGFIDELYIYDEALSDGMVKTLFEEGNPPESPVAPEYDAGSAEPEPAEPEPLPAAPVDSSAIATLGTPERVLGWWTDHTDAYELADGATVKFKLNNYSDGINNWDNFILAFTNTAVKADTTPSADNYDGYAEYAVIRADAFGWGDASYAGEFTTSWGDAWADWLKLMTDAEVDIAITRAGGEVNVDFTFTGADGTVMTETAKITSTMAADSPVYVHIGGEAAYIEVLSAE